MTSIEINRELLAIKEDVKAKRIASVEVYYTLKFWAKCDNLNYYIGIASVLFVIVLTVRVLPKAGI